jgi:hypothetical protein
MSVRPTVRTVAASLSLVALVALVGAVAAPAAAAPGMAPTLTVRAHYVAADHNIAFSGIALPKGDRMLAVMQFRLEQERAGGWRPISVYMALITGVGARWQPDGRYHSQLMAMNEPVPAGRLRVEMRVADNTGLATVAYSNPVDVP